MFLGAVACAALAAWPAPQEKKEKEEETQALQLPKDLPTAVTGETRRLTFHATPLSAKGLLSAQVRNALKALGRQASGQTVLHIRAFVAGAGDLRRVRDLVSEHYSGRRQPLPSLSLVRSGGLSLTGAQVLLEAIASSPRKEVNPGGLAFLSARAATSEDPLDPVAPLTAKTLAALRQEVRAAGAEAPDVLRVTCYFSSLDNIAASRTLVEAEYPRAALSYLQTQRAPAHAMAACEAVARLRWPAGAPLRLVNVESLPAEPGQSDVAVVGARSVVLTGTQVSFGYEETDARLAFERLRSAVEQAGGPGAEVACARYYALASGIAAHVRKIRLEFFGGPHAPAGALLLAEGLPSMDAGFAVDAIAVRGDAPASGRASGRAPHAVK